MIETHDYCSKFQDDFLIVYRACLAHYQIDPATSVQEERVANLLNSGRHMSCLMAYDGAEPAGFATWSLTLPAGSGIALYMKEMFVVKTARGKGAGRKLFAGLLDRAEREGCIRMDWQTDRSNPLSQAFYTQAGAPKFDKQTYRVMADDFSNFKTTLTSLC